MAELILPWVNSLKLSKKVTCIEKDFSNGFLFGEILVKLKQLESTSEFVYANTPAARVNNFTLLEPVLRRLDIRLDTNKIQLIVEEQEGAALQLLYQIKVAISMHSKNCGRSLSDISRVISTEKPSYEAAQKKFLDERLRKLIWPPKNELAKTRATSSRGRSRRQGNAELYRSPIRQQRAHIRSPQHLGRQCGREKHREVRKERSPEQDGGYLLTPSEMPRNSPGGKARAPPTGKNTLLTKAKEAKLSEEEVQKGIAHFEMNLQRLGLDAASSTTATISVGDVFPTGGKPQNLEIELSKRLSSSTCYRENAKMMERLHEARAAQELARKEREKRRQKLLLEQNQARAASAASAVEKAFIERTQRRSKRAGAVRYELWKVKQYQTVIEENRALRDAQYAKKRHLQEVMTTERTSHGRAVVRESLCREVHLEAAQCRALKKQLHAAKRARLIEECLDIVDLLVDMIAAASLHIQQHDTAVIDSRTWRDWLIAFVEGTSALPITGGQPSDGTGTGRHLVGDSSQSFLQLSGPSVAESMLLLHCPHTSEGASPTSMEVGSAKMENRLSEDDFFLYLNGEGQWQVHTNAEEAADSENLVEDLLKGATASEVFSELLKCSELSYPGATERLKTEVPTNPNGEPALYRVGSIVSALLDFYYSESPSPRPTDIPNCPLRIVITGKPFAGKHTLAKKLGEKFKLHVINFADLLKEVLALQHDPVTCAIEGGEGAAGEPVSPPLPVVTLDNHCPGMCMLRLATEAKTVLKEGEKLSSKLCVDLCVAKIQEVFVPGTLDNVKELLRQVPVKEQSELTYAHKNEKNNALTARKSPKAPTNAKDKNPPAKEVPDESTQQKLGWILVDFPQSYEQCVFFEERLSGYVTPDRLPASEVSRKKAQASFVIPLPEQSHTSQVRSFDRPKVQMLHLHFVKSPELSEKMQRKYYSSCLIAVSIADECCYIEEEQKVAHLFLNSFGVPGEPRLQILRVKNDAEVLAAASGIIEKVVNRKRQKFAREIIAESSGGASVAADQAPEATAASAGDDCMEASCSKRASTLIGEGEPCSSATEADVSEADALEQDVKRYLMAKWEALEDEYNASMMKLFAWIRQTRREFARGIVGIQVHFSDLLQRPDSKQEIVDAFIVEYNAFVSNVAQSLHLDTVKEEMHLQVDELAESLWEQIDTRRKEATTEHKRLVETGWLEAVCLVLAAQLEALVEAELKRYLALEEFATDAYYNILNACISDKKGPALNSSALKDAAQGAAKQAFAWLCKQKTSNHDAVHKPWHTHIFEQLEAKAKEHLVPLTEFEDYTPTTVEVDRKKANKTKLPVREETKPRVEPPLHVELQQTRLELQVQLFCRLRRLCLWGATRVRAAMKSGNDVFGRLDDWIIARSLAEHAAVRELITRIKYCIENERQIPHAMTLSGTQLILDPNALLGDLEDKEVSHCALPVPPTSAFTIAMLRSLMSDIKLVATGGLISVEALREIIMRRVTHSKCFRTQALPQTWLGTPASKLAHIPNYFEISGGYVDVIEFLLSLAFGPTGWPSNRQLVEICQAVRAASSDAAVAELGFRSGAAPLEFFVSREEFDKINFGDWLVACSRGEEASKMIPGDAAGGCLTFVEEESSDEQLQGQRAKQQLGKNAERSLLSFLFDVFIAFQSPLKSCHEEVSALQSLGFWAEADMLQNEDSTPSSAEGRRNSLTADQQELFDQRGTQEVYARKLLGYLALGSSPGEGLQRLLAVSVERCPYDIVPMLKQEDFLSVYDLYMTCTGVGVRPLFQPVPPTVKVPLSSFYKMLYSDGKGLEPAGSSQGSTTVTQRVNVLEFLNSASCTHMLMYSGPYFIRRSITNFI